MFSKCKFLILVRNVRVTRNFWNIPLKAELETNYLYNKDHIEEIESNILKRKGVGNIRRVHELLNKIEQGDTSESIKQNLLEEALKIPNRTHPEVLSLGDSPRVMKTIGSKREFGDNKAYQFDEITRRMKLVRMDQLGNFCGSRSYYLLGQLAELETALINFVLAHLFKNKFELISVPDILHRDIIEACGMPTKGQRTQVYSLDEKHGSNLCLSGTSEMALGGLLINQTLKDEELPVKFAAVSRCYRAETSKIAEERGIYRVHEFTKVEMFAVTTPEKSDAMLEEIRSIQEEIFESLGLHFVVLDMPAHELGAQAYRKFDLEAWLCGRNIYGEISSCSNCTDFQSRRLGIKYSGGFVHTLNGTACAIPRLLVALVEGNQNKNGTITIPKVLQKYMQNEEVIVKQKKIPELKLIKSRRS